MERFSYEKLSPWNYRWLVDGWSYAGLVSDGNHSDLTRPSQGRGFLRPHISVLNHFVSIAMLLMIWYQLPRQPCVYHLSHCIKAVFLRESSKFLFVIICHMTRFSEIWSACFRLGAHHQGTKPTNGGNSFKCQKRQESGNLPTSCAFLCVTSVMPKS